jgi:hypothetical protein
MTTQVSTPRRRDAMRRASERYREKKRIAAGAWPTDRTTQREVICKACQWSHEVCLSQSGPGCPWNLGGPNEACLTRFVSSGSAPRRCGFYHVPCSKRMCDCPTGKNRLMVCENCYDDIPVEDIHFIHEVAHQGLVETKQRCSRGGTYYTTICSGCLFKLREARKLNKGRHPFQMMGQQLMSSRTGRRKH